MTGAIIVVAFTYYILTFLIGGTLQTDPVVTLGVPVIIPPLIAGLLGGMQYARPERRGMRIPRRLSCAFKSCLAIVLAPLLILMVLFLVYVVAGGFSFLPAVPGIASFLTVAGLISMAIFSLYELTAIFIGLTAGQWLQFKWMTR